MLETGEIPYFFNSLSKTSSGIIGFTLEMTTLLFFSTKALMLSKWFLTLTSFVTGSSTIYLLAKKTHTLPPEILEMKQISVG